MLHVLFGQDGVSIHFAFSLSILLGNIIIIIALWVGLTSILLLFFNQIILESLFAIRGSSQCSNHYCAMAD